MSRFWQGFEKRATSITGQMPGLQPGLRARKVGAQITTPRPPAAGVAIAPRSTPPPLPTPAPAPGAAKTMTHVAAPVMPTAPKPQLQEGKGVSGAAI